MNFVLHDVVHKGLMMDTEADTTRVYLEYRFASILYFESIFNSNLTFSFVQQDLKLAKAR